MKQTKRIFFYTLMLLAFVLGCPFWAQANTPLLAGVAGPAVNLIYAYVTQDAGLWKKHDLDTRVAAGVALIRQIL